MPFKYLCIDDAAEEVTKLARTLVDGCKDLEIEVRTPSLFDEEIDRILPEKPQGVIIDLRLDEYPDSEGIRVKYRAMSLAQELRTRMTEGEMASAPLVLWSSDQKFATSFQPDNTGHDLFDLVLHKGRLAAEKETIQCKLISLILGYQRINDVLSAPTDSARVVWEMLGLNNDAPIPDPRLGEELVSNSKTPVHDFAHYLMENFVSPNGYLIDEATLAARLGIDIEKSADWVTLLEKELKEIQYTGIFSEAWPRWWMQSLRTWWHGKLGQSSPLERLNADERVSILVDKFPGIALQAPEQKDQSIPSAYWYVCRAENVPIDPSISVQVGFDENKPTWLDGEFISMQAALERKHIPLGLRVHPLERERVMLAAKSG